MNSAALRLANLETTTAQSSPLFTFIRRFHKMTGPAGGWELLRSDQAPAVTGIDLLGWSEIRGAGNQHRKQP